ncbi:MAG: LysE family translocator [Gammaproteobacteria bacterium]|nr:LysE family translocator [Gammaproteobacteria bacterium]
MPSTEVLLAFTATALLLNLSPGPSNFYIMARSIAQGTRGGIVATLGLAVGSMVHVAATVVGVSAIFRHSPTLFTVVKLLGAAYLVYLGIKYWQSKTTDDSKIEKKVRGKPLSKVFRESIVVEVTNPKTALFFIALLPQFVVPESGSISLQLFILGLIVTISALPCDMLVAVSSSKASNWISKNKRAQRIQERASASILFGMGAFIVVDEATDFTR